MTCVMLRVDKVSVVAELNRRAVMHRHHIIIIYKRSLTRCRAGAARSSAASPDSKHLAPSGGLKRQLTPDLLYTAAAHLQHPLGFLLQKQVSDHAHIQMLAPPSEPSLVLPPIKYVDGSTKCWI